MLTLALAVMIGGQAVAGEECLARWAIAGVVPGMQADSIRTKTDAASVDKRLPSAIIPPSPISGLSSKAAASVCVDGSGAVSLLRIDLDGSSDELRSDLRALEKRWADAVKVPLGVSDSLVGRGVAGSYSESIYDSCGWNALLVWSEDRTGMRGITIGVRQGMPEFVTARGDKLAIDHELLRKVAWQYVSCQPRPGSPP